MISAMAAQAWTGPGLLAQVAVFVLSACARASIIYLLFFFLDNGIIYLPWWKSTKESTWALILLAERWIWQSKRMLRVSASPKLMNKTNSLLARGICGCYRRNIKRRETTTEVPEGDFTACHCHQPLTSPSPACKSKQMRNQGLPWHNCSSVFKVAKIMVSFIVLLYCL